MNKRKILFIYIQSLFYVYISLLKIYGQKGFDLVDYRITSHQMCSSPDFISNTITRVSVQQCVEECASISECSAVNYKRRFRICELHSIMHENFTVLSKGSCVYVKRKDMDIAEATIDICDSCEDGGSCDPNQCILKCNICLGHSTQTINQQICPALEIEDGILHGNMRTVGSLVEIVCHKYFKERSGETHVNCQSNGTWAHSPECTPSFRYIGCYEDREERIIHEKYTIIDAMTTEMCVKLCFSSDFKYALTEVGIECFCGNTLRNYPKKPDDDCNIPCQGNSSQMCGAGWRGSVYKHM